MFEPTAIYAPNPHRYDTMTYNRAGTSGLKLPAVSLGFWHNFGDITPFDQMKSWSSPPSTTASPTSTWPTTTAPNPARPRRTADCCSPSISSITATTRHLHQGRLRNVDRPYGDLGSRKYLLASLDQSLERLGLDYVDIFYHHHPDPETPLEETMGALAQAVNSGKALYVGLSNYDGPTVEKAAAILAELHVRSSSTRTSTTSSTAPLKRTA